MYWLKVVLIFLRKKIFEIGKGIGIGVLFIIGGIVAVSLILGMAGTLGWILTRFIVLVAPRGTSFTAMADHYISHGLICIFTIAGIAGIFHGAKKTIKWIQRNWQEAKLEAKK